MATEGNQKQERRRRQFLIDLPFQFSMTGKILFGLGAVGMLMVCLVFIVPDADYFGQLTGAEVRGLLLKIIIAYFLLAFGFITFIMMVLSQRLAGPVMVLKRGLEGFQQQIYSHRLHLRKSDYLKDLAAGARDLRDFLEAKDLATEDLLQGINDALESNDLEKARELATRGVVLSQALHTPVMVGFSRSQPASVRPAPAS